MSQANIDVLPANKIDVSKATQLSPLGRDLKAPVLKRGDTALQEYRQLQVQQLHLFEELVKLLNEAKCLERVQRLHLFEELNLVKAEASSKTSKKSLWTKTKKLNERKRSVVQKIRSLCGINKLNPSDQADRIALLENKKFVENTIVAMKERIKVFDAKVSTYQATRSKKLRNATMTGSLGKEKNKKLGTYIQSSVSIPILKLYWEILPSDRLPSSLCRVERKNSSSPTCQSTRIELLAFERFRFYEYRKPTVIYAGTKGFHGYFMYCFNKYIVLDSIKTGNAIYIFHYADLDYLQGLSKTELLNNQHPHLQFERIIHDSLNKWQQKVKPFLT